MPVGRCLGVFVSSLVTASSFITAFLCLKGTMKGLKGAFALVVLHCMHCLLVLGFEYRIREVYIMLSREYKMKLRKSSDEKI